MHIQIRSNNTCIFKFGNSRFEYRVYLEVSLGIAAPKGFSSKLTKPYLFEHFFILVSGSHQFLNEAIREIPTQHIRHQEGRLLHGPAGPRQPTTAMSPPITT